MFVFVDIACFKWYNKRKYADEYLPYSPQR